jgi:5-(carboxyamino)imidazole ribonucleotide mutase
MFNKTLIENNIKYFCGLYKIDINMKAKVSIIMGSTSDFPVMEAAAKFFDEMEIPFEVNALSAHRTPEKVEVFAKSAKANGIKVIVAAAGMAAHLPGVIAAMTTVPVIGVPIKASLDGMDSLLSIVQMPPGIPVATVGINASLNAAILATQILAVGDDDIAKKLEEYKTNLKMKIVKANEDLAKISFKYKVN